MHLLDQHDKYNLDSSSTENQVINLINEQVIIELKMLTALYIFAKQDFFFNIH